MNKSSERARQAQPVLMSDIENFKENIEPAVEGRSASSLVKTFSQDPANINKSEQITALRRQYEASINMADELDDPIEPWIAYIKWLKETFPQGNSSVSGLAETYERCVHQFENSTLYLNDPRYIKVWMDYLAYFDAPLELFKYMQTKKIGTRLSIYYEQYALYLEAVGRKDQANQIYQLGIKSGAEPQERLLKRYNEFKDRMLTDQPNFFDNQPQMIQRPILAEKLAPDSVASGPSEASSVDGKVSKLTVFQDHQVLLSHKEAQPSVGSNGWSNLGTIQEMKRENKISATQWVGQRLPQKGSSVSSAKLSVFNDRSQPTKRSEKLAIDLDLVFPEEGKEYSLEELVLRTKKMKLMFKKYINRKNTPQKELQRPNESPRKPEQTSNGYTRKKVASPTINTKAALQDIFEIMNRPLKFEQEAEEDSSSESESSDSSQIHPGPIDVDPKAETFNRSKDKVTDLLDDIKLEDEHTLPFQNAEKSGESNKPFLCFQDPSPQNPEDTARSKPNLIPFMTPILESENTESSKVFQRQSNIFKLDPIEPSNTNNGSSINLEELPEKPFFNDSMCDPFERSSRDQIVLYYEKLGITNGMLKDKSDSLMQKLPKNIVSSKIGGQTSATAIFMPDEFTRLEMLCKLGEGAFGSVYLCNYLEDKSKQVAVKVEQPASVWEFYIIHAIRKASFDESLLHSIVRPISSIRYKDSSLFIMEYYGQGTLLNAINHFKDIGISGNEEMLVMFFVARILKTMLSLHSVGFLHGDIKPDNCLLNLKNINSDSWDSIYHPDGNGQWKDKNIVLIDLGRAINLNHYSSEVQFFAECKAAQTDCTEMQQMRPWKYQIDYYGLANVAHALLFGKFIETKYVPNNKGGYSSRITQTLKRYWHVDLWNKFFGILLLDECFVDDKPNKILGGCSDQLSEIQAEMESILESNAHRGQSLKITLRRLLAAVQTT